MKIKNRTTIRKILPLIWRSPIYLLVFILATFLQVLLTVYLPILIGQAVDMTLETDFSPAFGAILLQMGIVVFANTLLQ